MIIENNDINDIPDQELIQFGKRVKAIRKALHLLQKDFAIALGISGGYLSEIEAGKTKAGFDFIRNITRAHDINPNYLLHGTGPMFSSPSLLNEVNSVPPPSVDFGWDNEEVKEMLDYMQKFSIVRFTMLSFFKNFIFKRRTLLEEELKKMKNKEIGMKKEEDS